MPVYFFYKAVKDGHIRGLALFQARGPGIKGYGLDPYQRNAAGGATAVAAAQSGRALSAADLAAIGQCLTGSRQYAADYADTSDHVLLRIALTEQDLRILVKSAATHERFMSMEEAQNARECTAIARILPTKIDYATEDNTWVPIYSYKNPKPKDFSKAVVSVDDDW